MQIKTTFDQDWAYTASRLSSALELLDAGKLDEARKLILDTKQANEEQAQVIDPRIYAAVRHVCEARKVDSRRLLPLLLVLGFREISRTLLMGSGVDLIEVHQPIENDFFATMLAYLPQSDKLSPLVSDDARNAHGLYQNGNQQLWELFSQQEEAVA